MIELVVTAAATTTLRLAGAAAIGWAVREVWRTAMALRDEFAWPDPCDDDCDCRG